MAVLNVPRPQRFSPNPTLGPQVAADIERWCVFGPGDMWGQPAALHDEHREWLGRMYEIHPLGSRREGQRVFGRCVLELRKGVAKTEFAAWICYMELHPWSHVRFAGFDKRGELLAGKSVESPYIPMMAAAEEQVQELAFGVLKFVIENSPTRHLFACSLERIVRLGEDGTTNAGIAVAVSNAPSTRDGARTTFQHVDESHWLVQPLQKAAIRAMLENIGKRALATPWTLFTSTAGTPGANSVQEDLRIEAELIDQGLKPNPRLFFHARWAGDDHDLSTVEGRIAAIKDATGPGAEWATTALEDIALQYDQIGCDQMYWERVWLNRWRKSNAGAYNIEKVKKLLAPNESIAQGAFVTVGFDGAVNRDSTAIVITEILTGRQELVAIWERPDDAAPDWEIDPAEVNETMEWVFQHYDVWRAYCDPPFWTETVAKWVGKWPGRVIEYETKNVGKAVDMARCYLEAIEGEQIKFVGALVDTMFRHISNAGRKEVPGFDDQGQKLWRLQKLDGLDRNKFDAAMAGNLSWKARLIAIADGARPSGGGIPRRLYG